MAWLAIIIAGALIIFIGAAIDESRNKPIRLRKSLDDASALCPCGDPATHTIPYIAINRGVRDLFRRFFGAPQTYRLVSVSKDEGKPMVCEAHLPVVENMLRVKLTNVALGWERMSVVVQLGLSEYEKEGWKSELKNQLFTSKSENVDTVTKEETNNEGNSDDSSD